MHVDNIEDMYKTIITQRYAAALFAQHNKQAKQVQVQANDSVKASSNSSSSSLWKHQRLELDWGNKVDAEEEEETVVTVVTVVT